MRVLIWRSKMTIPRDSFWWKFIAAQEATVAHKATAHYAAWRDRMESLMAEPRYSVKYSSVFPGEEG